MSLIINDLHPYTVKAVARDGRMHTFTHYVRILKVEWDNDKPVSAELEFVYQPAHYLENKKYYSEFSNLEFSKLPIEIGARIKYDGIGKD